MTRFTPKFLIKTSSIESGGESCSGQNIGEWRGSGEWRGRACCKLADMSMAWHQSCKSTDLRDLELAITYDPTQEVGASFIGDNI